jgi:hypothetical protein
MALPNLPAIVPGHARRTSSSLPESKYNSRREQESKDRTPLHRLWRNLRRPERNDQAEPAARVPAPVVALDHLRSGASLHVAGPPRGRNRRSRVGTRRTEARDKRLGIPQGSHISTHWPIFTCVGSLLGWKMFGLERAPGIRLITVSKGRPLPTGAPPIRSSDIPLFSGAIGWPSTAGFVLPRPKRRPN